MIFTYIYTYIHVDRIKWEEMVAITSSVSNGTGNGNSDSSIPLGYELDQYDTYTSHGDGGGGSGWGQQHSDVVHDNDKNEDDDEDDDDEDDDDEIDAHNHSNSNSIGQSGESGESLRLPGNKCELVWQGVVPKRTFTGFKFQEARNAVAARKVFDSKNVAHYWDLAYSQTTF